MREHASDCALHNGPAYPPGSCNCRNPVEFAADAVERKHGRAALAALSTFLRALPSSATLNWGDGEWSACAMLAEQMQEPSEI
jgi:hypothetical protein